MPDGESLHIEVSHKFCIIPLLIYFKIRKQPSTIRSYGLVSNPHIRSSKSNLLTTKQVV
jgi:hypothetical protein